MLSAKYATIRKPTNAQLALSLARDDEDGQRQPASRSAMQAPSVRGGTSVAVSSQIDKPRWTGNDDDDGVSADGGGGGLSCEPLVCFAFDVCFGARFDVCLDVPVTVSEPVAKASSSGSTSARATTRKLTRLL